MNYPDHKHASDYARIMLHRDKHPRTIRPSEWDFREIQEAELVTAIDYELQRENISFRKSVANCLDTVVAGKTVRQHLQRDGLPAKLGRQIEALFKSDYNEIRFAHTFHFFPAPWLSFERDRIELAREWIVDEEPSTPEQRMELWNKATK